MLYGREAPEEGGETWFAGTAQAYDDLDGEARAALDGLMVKHVKNGGGDKLALPEEHERALTLESQTTEEERKGLRPVSRSEEHTSELQSLMRISYAVFCLKKKKTIIQQTHRHHRTTINTHEPTR